MKKYGYVGVLLLVHILIIFAPLLQTGRDRIILSYDVNNLVLNSGYADNVQNLTHIDDTYDFEGYFAYTAPVPVNKGRYLVTIEYNADNYGNGMDILNAGADSFDKVLMDDINLDPEKNQASFYIWVKEDLEKFQLASVYGGDGTFEVIKMTAHETRTQSLMDMFEKAGILALIDGIILISYFRKKDRFNMECIYCAIALFGVVMFVSMPLLNDFLIKGSDMEFHMLRIEGIKEGLLAGQFPVRIQPVQLNGHGYPVSLFYGDLFLYIPAVLRIIGIPVQTCYKLVLVAINAMTCILMYFSVKGIFKDRRIGVFAAAFYAMVPYRLNSLYIRAAVGEMIAYAFLPLIIYGLYQIFVGESLDKRHKTGYLSAVIGYSGVIHSHILTCEFVGVFTILVCLILVKKTLQPKRLLELVKVVIVTVLLNAAFLVPFFDMMISGGVYILEKYTFAGQFIQGQGLNIASLLDLFPSGNGIVYNNALREYGNYGMKGEQGMTIGLGLIMLMGMPILYWLAKKEKNIIGNEQEEQKIQVPHEVRETKEMHKVPETNFGLLCSLMGFFALYMSLNSFPWDALESIAGRMVSNIQFPWRILCIAAVFGVFAGCVYLYNESDRAKPLAAVVLLLMLISSGWCMHDRLYENMAYYVYDKAGLDTTMTGSGSWNEYVPTETNVDELTEKEPVVYGDLQISDYKKDYTNIFMMVEGKSAGSIEVPLLFYKGYQALDENGDRLNVKAGTNNVLSVEIPENFKSYVNISYQGMRLWHMADIVSLITAVILLLMQLWRLNTIWKKA